MALAAPLVPVRAIGGNEPPAMTIFAVFAEGAAGVPADQRGLLVAPIAIVAGGSFQEPPDSYHEAPAPSPAAAQRFVREQYAKGRRLHLFWGGQRAGTATVEKVWVPLCTGLFAKVRLDPGLRIGRAVRALATSRALKGAPSGSRRAPSDAERGATLAAVQKAFRRHGVKVAMARIRVGNLTVLEGPIAARIIGDFWVTDRGGLHNLFLILAADAGGLRPELEKTNRSVDEDGQDSQSESLVDWLDLDGDRVPELITQTDEWEYTSYTIYRLRKGHWERVYHGGGFGC